MAIRLMEGFETTYSLADLQAHGWVSSNFHGVWHAARYANGKAFRKTSTSNAANSRKLVGPFDSGSGLAFSFVGMQTNLSASLAVKPTKIQGEYYSGSGQTTPIFRWDNFETPQSYPPPGTIIYQSVLWDPNRELWIRVGVASTNTTTNNFRLIVTETLDDPGTVLVKLGTQNIGNFSRTFLTQEGNIFFTARGRASGMAHLITLAANEDPATAPWNVVVLSAISGTAVLVDAAWVGDKWMAVVNTLNIVATSTDGLSWTTSAVANSSGISIAYGNDTIVIGRSGSNNGVAVSTDGGASFTPVSLPATPGGFVATNPTVRFGNGRFVLLGSTDGLWVSEDGFSWDVYDNPSLQIQTMTAINGDSFVFQEGEFLIANSYSSLLRSTDGLLWEATDSNWQGSTSSSGTGFALAGAASNAERFALVQPGSAVNQYVRVNGTLSAALGDYPVGSHAVYEGSLVSIDDTNYNVSLTMDGVERYNSSFQSALFATSGAVTALPSSPNTKQGQPLGCTDGNGTWIMQNNTGITVSKDDLVSGQFVDLSSFGIAQATCSGVLWTGTRFVLMSSVTWMESFDGLTWSAIDMSGTGAPSIEVTGTSFVHESTVFVTGSTAVAGYFYSLDSGATWNYNGSQPLQGSVAYLDGLWVVVDAPSNTAGTIYYTDDITAEAAWSSVDGTIGNGIIRAYNAVVHQGSIWLAVNGTIGKVYRVQVVEGVPVPSWADLDNAGTASSFSQISKIGDYLIYSYSSSTGTNARMWYSADGLNWTQTTAPVSGNNFHFVIPGPRVGLIIRGSTGVSAYLIPRYCDQTFFFQIGANWSLIDDIVVTDFNQPNAGPQGECRIVLMDDDNQVQAQWSPHPEDLTNIEAGTKIPTSITYDTYVEASEVGQKDVYGSSDFQVPAGLRPLAVQVEGSFERVFTNVPEVQLGLQVGESSDTTPSVPIQSQLGDTTYIQKIVERNPDGNTSWTREAIANAQSTIEKTA